MPHYQGPLRLDSLNEMELQDTCVSRANLGLDSLGETRRQESARATGGIQ